MADLSLAAVSKILEYDPSSGKLFWKTRTEDMFPDGKRPAERSCRSWNTRYAGKEALTNVSPMGYRRGCVYGRLMLAHRVIWLLHYGTWPSDQIDHINGHPSDNRIKNLRDVSNLVNGRNQRRSANNTSGFSGVYWCKRRSKWVAQIKLCGRYKFLGHFETIEEAIEVRRATEIKNGFHPNHGRAA